MRSYPLEVRSARRGSDGSRDLLLLPAVLAPQEGLASIVFVNLNEVSPSFDGCWSGDLCIWALQHLLQQMLDGVF